MLYSIPLRIWVSVYLLSRHAFWGITGLIKQITYTFEMTPFPKLSFCITVIDRRDVDKDWLWENCQIFRHRVPSRKTVLDYRIFSAFSQYSDRCWQRGSVMEHLSMFPWGAFFLLFEPNNIIGGADTWAHLFPKPNIRVDVCSTRNQHIVFHTEQKNYKNYRLLWKIKWNSPHPLKEFSHIPIIKCVIKPDTDKMPLSCAEWWFQTTNRFFFTDRQSRNWSWSSLHNLNSCRRWTWRG